MNQRTPRRQGRSSEVDDLVTELGDLVETLGLEEGAPAPRSPRLQPRRRRAPAAEAASPSAVVEEAVQASAATPAVDLEEEEEVVPGAVEQQILQDSTLWIPPAEMIEPGGRPWSPAAAMETLPGTPGGAPAVAVGRTSWVMTVSACTAVVLAVFAIVVSRIDLARTGGPEHAVSAAPFGVSVLRTVAVDSAGAVATAPTTTRFGASTNHLFIDIHYTGATPRDSLELKVIHDSDGLPPPAVVQDHTYALDSPSGTGTLSVELTAPSGEPFASGRYTVTVVHGQRNAQTVDFTVGA